MTRAFDKSATDSPFPLRIAGHERFATVRELLKTAGFDEPTVCAALELGDMADLSGVDREKVDLDVVAPTLRLLIRLFLFTEPVSRAEVEQTIESRLLESLIELDLLRPGNLPEVGSEEHYYTPVFLYPVADFVIASDRRSNPDGSPYTPPGDIVFPAIFGGTLLFLKMISKAPARDALDLCSGTGIAALVLSKTCERVVASDITARATHFALFNTLLNDCRNVEVVQGDLYDPVANRTFDRIVAHPPYVPTLQSTAIYRDGGETGEIVSRRIVEGLPAHLRSGGTYYSMSMGIDTTDAAFETRARRWMGDAESEFDVVFGLSDERTPKEFARETVVSAAGSQLTDIRRWEELFREAGVRRLVYGALIAHRLSPPDAGAEPLTARLRMSNVTRAESFDWWIDLRRRLEQRETLERLANATARMSSFTKLRVTHSMEDGVLIPGDFQLETDRPFLNGSKIDAWVAQIAAELDGKRLIGELFEAAKNAAVLPEALTLNDFVRMLASLAERGYIEIDFA